MYLAGYFDDTVTFGATTLINVGFDVFVAKWNPATGFVWAQSAGGTTSQYPYVFSPRMRLVGSCEKSVLFCAIRRIRIRGASGRGRTRPFGQKDASFSEQAPGALACASRAYDLCPVPSSPTSRHADTIVTPATAAGAAGIAVVGAGFLMG